MLWWQQQTLTLCIIFSSNHCFPTVIIEMCYLLPLRNSKRNGNQGKQISALEKANGRAQVYFLTFSLTIKIYYRWHNLNTVTVNSPDLLMFFTFCSKLQVCCPWAQGCFFFYFQDHRAFSDLLLSILLPTLFNKSANHLRAERLAESKIKHVLWG